MKYRLYIAAIVLGMTSSAYPAFASDSAGSTTSQRPQVDWNDWFKHVNLTLHSVNGNPRVTSPSHSATFKIKDDYDTEYEFNMVQQGINGTPKGFLGGTLRVPLYYTRSFSLGLHGSMKGMQAHVFPEGSFYGFSGGLYVRQDLGRLGVHGFIGLAGYSVSGTIGEIEATYPGDPGASINDVWYELGSKMTVRGTSEVSRAWGAGARYSFLPAVFAEVAYQSWGPGTIRFAQYVLRNESGDTQKYTKETLPKPVEVSEHTMVNIGIGFGY